MKIYVTFLPDIEKQPDLINKYEKLLSSEDDYRYQHMTNATRRLQFLLGRALIQDVCHQSPKLLSNGKPMVENGYISLAHSGSYVLLAVSEKPIGIDIEDITKNKDFLSLANRLHFELSSDTRLSFYRQFTRYESTFKAGKDISSLYHSYYSINTFIICVSSLNKNKKIDFVKSIPFVEMTNFNPISLDTEDSNDL